MVYKEFNLKDGRTVNLNWLKVEDLPEVVEALNQHKHADKEEYISIEKEVKGRIFVFKQQRYVLSDGTEIIVSTGMPK